MNGEKTSQIRWLLIFWLFVLSAVAFLDRVNISIAGTLLASDFHLVLGSSARSTAVATVVLAAGAGSLYLSQSSFWSVTADIGGASSGSVSGLMNMGNQLGGALTLSLTPWIARHLGWKVPFFVPAALCLCGGIGLAIRRPAKSVGLRE